MVTVYYLMKSEVEQFNKLQLPPPLYNFNQINFQLADERPLLSYPQASTLCEQCEKYFTFGQPSSSLIRNRHKVNNPYNFHEYTAQPYIETAQDITNLSYTKCDQNDQRITGLTKLIGGYLRRRDYDIVIELLNKRPQQFYHIGIIPIFAFIAAIIRDDDENEFNIFQIIEELMIFDIRNLTHFFHLFDELQLLKENDKYPTPLLDLNILEIGRLKKMLKNRFHIMPNLNINTKYVPVQYKTSGTTQLCNSIKSRLPQLLPICEGFLGITNDPKPLPASFSFKVRPKPAKNRSRTPVKSKDSSDVLALIAQSKWNEAVARSTEALAKSPNDTDMYLHRAFSLYHIEKMEDALNDCTLSLSIKKTDKALRMRASFWLLLGEADLSLEDLQMMDDKTLYQSVMKQSSNNNNGGNNVANNYINNNISNNNNGNNSIPNSRLAQILPALSMQNRH